MNNKIYFKIDDTVLIKETPVPQYGEGVYKSEIVIDKETFIKCYEMWIKGEKKLSENKGEWISQSSNKEQGERDFIWWKCSKCGQVIYSETEKDREEFHAFCGRCGADMRGE